MKIESTWLRGIRRWAATLPRLPESEAGGHCAATDNPPPTTVHHHVQRTPLSVVRAGVERARRQLRAEEIARTFRPANATQRRINTETAKAFRNATAFEPPRPYDAAIEERRLRDQLREARR